MTVDEFVTQLRSAYGSALRGVVLFGSAVIGEHIKKQSDYNILVVVDQLPLDRLAAASAVMRAWRDSGNPAPLTFTSREWRDSGDVFAMEYADILEGHKLLHGDASLFDGIVVDRADLRRQVEYEATGKVLKLRQGVLLAGNDRAAQVELLAASLSTIMVVFRGVVRLLGERSPRNYAELVRVVAERTGIDPAPLHAVIRHVRGEQVIAKADAEGVLAGYLGAMEAVAAFVDAQSQTRTE